MHDPWNPLERRGHPARPREMGSPGQTDRGVGPRWNSTRVGDVKGTRYTRVTAPRQDKYFRSAVPPGQKYGDRVRVDTNKKRYVTFSFGFDFFSLGEGAHGMQFEGLVRF